jgi:hypothetical protein
LIGLTNHIPSLANRPTGSIDVACTSSASLPSNLNSLSRFRSSAISNVADRLEPCPGVGSEPSEALALIANIRLITLSLSPLHHPLKIWTRIFREI